MTLAVEHAPMTHHATIENLQQTVVFDFASRSYVATIQLISDTSLRWNQEGEANILGRSAGL